jgi:hypothetical protein
MRIVLLLLLSLNSFSQVKGDKIPLKWEFNFGVGGMSSVRTSDIGFEKPDFQKVRVTTPLVEFSGGIYIKDFYNAIEIQSGLSKNYTNFNYIVGYKVNSWRFIGGITYYHFNNPRVYIKNYGFTPRASVEKEFYILNTRFYVRTTGNLKSVMLSTGMTFD